MTATAKETRMRMFVLDRKEDATGTSGTGIVAEGVQFSNGQVVIHWLSQLEAINVYANAVVLEQLHGHGGRTTVRWLDEPSRLTMMGPEHAGAAPQVYPQHCETVMWGAPAPVQSAEGGSDGT